MISPRNMKTSLCWSIWLLLSCEWTLELLLNDQSKKSDGFTSERKVLKEKRQITPPGHFSHERARCTSLSMSCLLPLYPDPMSWRIYIPNYGVPTQIKAVLH